jgi:hypothetical protein
MGYALRYFAVSSVDSLVPALQHMRRAGLSVRLVGAEAYNVHYAPDMHPLTTGLTKAYNPVTQSEVAVFIEIVSQRPAYTGQRDVFNMLSRTQAIIAIGVPDDFIDYGSEQTLDFVVDSVSALGHGMLQVDGQGFFIDKQLIYEM